MFSARLKCWSFAPSTKQDLAGGVGIDVIKGRLNAGRRRVAGFNKARDARAALDLSMKI